jgi:hypothetical protein
MLYIDQILSSPWEMEAEILLPNIDISPPPPRNLNTAVTSLTNEAVR